MEARTLDISAGVITLFIFILLFLFLPTLLGGVNIGGAYILAIVIFVILLSAVGYYVNEKIQ